MGEADDGGLRNRRMCHERTLNLGGADAMAGHVQNIIDTSGDPNEAIFITSATVPGEIVARVWLHVHRQIALMISEAGPSNARPRLLDGQHSLDAVALNLLSSRRIQHDRVNAIKGQSTTARFHGGASGKIRHDMTARLGLPIGVDNRAVRIADNFIIPSPCLGVDRFAHGAQDPQARKIILLGDVVAEAHEGPDGRGSRVEDRDLMTLDHVPIATIVGIHGGRLEHECAQTIQQRTVDNVGMPGDPSSIGNTGIHIALLQIERCGGGVHGIQTVSSGGMDQTLGLAGRARRVQNEQTVFGIHPLAGAVGTLPLDELIDQHIARGVHLHAAAAVMGKHKQLLDNVRAGTALDGRVANLLEGEGPAAALATVGGDDPLGLAGLDPIGNGVGTETGENDGMDGTDASAGQHGHGQLGDHGHVQGDDIALADALILEGVGNLAHLGQEFAEGDAADVGGLISLPDDGHLIGPAIGTGGAVPIDGVVAGIDLAVEEPGDGTVGEGTGLDGGVRGEPRQVFVG